MKTPVVALSVLLAGALLPYLTFGIGSVRTPGDPVLAADILAPDELSATEQLGKAIFFDANLSARRNQACAECHDPAVGWTGSDTEVNLGSAVYPGSYDDRFGNRKPPSSAYATVAPVFHYDAEREAYVGGNFWDGRATGERLGSPAAEQALGPFLNPVEQALPDAACVVARVCTASYPVQFEDVWGADACPDVETIRAIEAACSAGEAPALAPATRERVNRAYDDVGRSIAAFEASREVNAYTSKFDAFRAGEARLTPEEALGLATFNGKGKCAACHTLTPGADGAPPVFTDFTFHNLGVPSNPANPVLAREPGWVDPGLAGFLEASGRDFVAENLGRQKVPTLRNVALGAAAGPKAFMHNGYFKTLAGVVHFYGTRDVKPACDGAFTEAEALAADCWPAPEVAENLNRDLMGDLQLTADEEKALVAFLGTLSDGWSAGR
jgi:cytochrome c peroxidase